MSISKQIDYPKVRTFLESIARNSKSSKNTYEMGLKHFQYFLTQNCSNIDTKYNSKNSSNNNKIVYHKKEEEDERYYNVETILDPLQDGIINVYELIDAFVSYLLRIRQQDGSPIAATSITLYVYSVRSYFQYFDIDINPAKFRRKVRLPKVAREDEEPLDANDIRKLLLACSNRRLKAYILVLASGGMRATEGLAIRNQDIDFTVSPTKIHIRKEYAKTRVARDIYISDEATSYLKQWLSWKFREDRVIKNSKRLGSTPMPDDLVFSPFRGSDPKSMYQKMIVEFRRLLSIAGIDARKEISRRRKYTPHSLRRFAKSVISDTANQDYSEWFLGHKKSPYYIKKEYELREIYRTKCMLHLTFLDYTTSDSISKDIEARLEEKDRLIATLQEKDLMSKDALATLSDRLLRLETKLAASEEGNNPSTIG